MNSPAFYDDFQFFCSRPQCLLHCAPGAPTVRGSGNWAVLPNGLVIGRQLVDGRMLCDACASDRGNTLLNC